MAEDILRIKHNDPTFAEFSVSVSLNNAALRRLGDIIGQNTTLQKLCICNGIDVEAMSTGLQNNRSIEYLFIKEIDLESNQRMSSLAPFFTHNPILK